MVADVVRRGLVGAMGNNLWKTMTVSEVHDRDTIGTTDYWLNYTGVSTQNDRDKFIYILVFTNNSGTMYPVNLIMNTLNANNASSKLSYREGYTVFYSGNRSNYCGAGTVIDIYRLPKE